MPKKWKIHYKSRYHPLESMRYKTVSGYEKKSDVRRDAHNIFETDEFRIFKVEEVK